MERRKRVRAATEWTMISLTRVKEEDPIVVKVDGAGHQAALSDANELGVFWNTCRWFSLTKLPLIWGWRMVISSMPTPSIFLVDSVFDVSMSLRVKGIEQLIPYIMNTIGLG
ncbi:hypothetical protein GQ457_14G016800 [Hibiscus cannabinus]